MIPQTGVDLDVDVDGDGDDIENPHEIQMLDDELIMNVLRIVFEDQEGYRLCPVFCVHSNLNEVIVNSSHQEFSINSF
jgi:hypothetical protein